MVRLFGLGRKPKTFEFRCSGCGQMHRGSPSFSYRRPSHVFDVPEDEREERILESDDLCVIKPGTGDDETRYFVRVTLNIPIHGVEDPFCWGVWVTQSEDSFNKYQASYGTDQTGECSFGWLAVELPSYRGDGEYLTHLQCDVHWGALGQRPHICLWDCEHQLAIDQRDGISWDRAIEIARLAMHG